MTELIYENSIGTKINLTQFPYWLNVEPIFDYEWDYTKRSRRRGDIVAGFAKTISEKTLTLHILGKTKAIRNAAIDAFNTAIEQDIYNGKIGKIWYGDWFTYGYIIASDNENWQYDTPIIKKKIKLVREQDSWYRQTLRKSYESDVLNVNTDSWVKTYDSSDVVYDSSTGTYSHVNTYDYQYGFMTDFESNVALANPDDLPSNFVLSIQGPADRPAITIGTNVIEFNYDLPSGAVLVVDSTQKTTKAYLNDGTVTNVFGSRNPNYYIFERIPSGKSSVSWNGDFTWEIKLIEERSEPRWLTD